MYWIADVKKEILDLYKFRWVSISTVSSGLRSRYKRSVLGFFWSLLGPILNYLVVGLVFSFMMRHMVPNYFVYMFSGTAIYNLLAVTIAQSPNVMILNEGYIKKIYLPKSLFVLNTVAGEYINFCLGLTALLVLGTIFQMIHLNWAFLFLPVPVLCALLFNFGVVSIISVATVFFRDLSHILPIVMQGVFFGTPILYSLEIVPEQFRSLVYFNPFYYFVESFRYPIYRASLPPPWLFFGLLAITAVVFVLGIVVLKKFENKIVFRL